MVLMKPLFEPQDLEGSEPHPLPDQPLTELEAVDTGATEPPAQLGKPQLSPLTT